MFYAHATSIAVILLGAINFVRRSVPFLICCDRVDMSANQYTNEELTEIHLCYGLADQKVEFAQRLYQGRYPHRRLPSLEIFEKVHKNLLQNGSFNSLQSSTNFPRKKCANRNEFCHWFNNNGADYSRDILFTDEKEFKGDGNFSLNVWCGIINGTLLGPIFFPLKLNGNKYLEFLQNDLTLMLRDFSDRRLQRMWFMHDGATPHACEQVRNHLDNMFPNRWIGANGPVKWPANSADLNPIDFYVWNYINKTISKSQKVNTIGEFEHQIRTAFDEFRNDPRHFEEMGTLMDLRIGMCIAENGDSIKTEIRKFFRNDITEI